MRSFSAAAFWPADRIWAVARLPVKPPCLEGLLIPRAPSASDRRAALRKEIEIVNVSFGSRPGNAVWWTVHGLARHLHVSTDTIQRVWREYGITRRVLWGRGYPDPVINQPRPVVRLADQRRGGPVLAWRGPGAGVCGRSAGGLFPRGRRW